MLRRKPTARRAMRVSLTSTFNAERELGIAPAAMNSSTPTAGDIEMTKEATHTQAFTSTAGYSKTDMIH